MIAGSVERKAKVIVEPRHLDRRNRTLTASIPCFPSHVHCSCLRSGQAAAGKGEPLVEPNPIVSRRASQAAPADLPLLISYQIISHMIDSYYIVRKLYVLQVNATGDLRPGRPRFQRLACK